LNFLIGHNSFKGKDILRNICTGVTADASVNFDHAVKVGKDVLVSITGMQVRDFKFSKKQQTVVMDVKTSVKVNGDRESFQADVQLLFHLIVTAVYEHRDCEDFKLQSASHIELGTPPPFLSCPYSFKS